MKTISTLLALIALVLTPAYSQVTVDNTRALKRAVSDAKHDEIILIAPGRYDLTDLKIRRDLTLKGQSQGATGDNAVFFSSQPVAKGLLNPVDGASLRVENIRFEGAVSPDLNGAGIRHDGANLSIIDCVFESNENGVLSTGREDGLILIENSAFLNSGHGDGYSHGIYVLHAQTLNIANSQFVGSKIGHHVKSLAARTNITGTAFDDADGRTSYAVDASRGGAVTISDNSFVQAANADNSTLINYDLSRGGEAKSLIITGNTIVNRNRNGRLLRNDTTLNPVIADNVIQNEAGGRLQAP